MQTIPFRINGRKSVAYASISAFLGLLLSKTKVCLVQIREKNILFFLEVCVKICNRTTEICFLTFGSLSYYSIFFRTNQVVSDHLLFYYSSQARSRVEEHLKYLEKSEQVILCLISEEINLTFKTSRESDVRPISLILVRSRKHTRELWIVSE